MPSSNTITAFNVFVTRTVIESAKMNENFSAIRGNFLPIDGSLGAAAVDGAYNLGSEGHRWKSAFIDDGISLDSLSMTANVTPSSGSYHIWNKEGLIVARNSAGEDLPIGPGGGWKKFLMTSGAFSTAGLTNTGTLFNLNPREIIEAYVVKHTTDFTSTAGSITALTFKVGLATERDRWVSGFDIKQAVTNTAFFAGQDFDLQNMGATTAVAWTVEAVGANLSALTQGQLTVWVKTSILP